MSIVKVSSFSNLVMFMVRKVDTKGNTRHIIINIKYICEVET